MSIEPVDANEEDMMHILKGQEPVVISTRIRLARNLDGYPFPGWVKGPQFKEVESLCVGALYGIPKFRQGRTIYMEELQEIDRLVLVERHFVSKELAAGKKGAAVISCDRSCSVMVNEEDHLRIQVVKPGWHLRSAWHEAEHLDDVLSAVLKMAFSEHLGYLTACPTNVGTGLRASAMVHLPGLCLAGQMDKVSRALSQDGHVVRGWLGEGTEAAGNIFQISNQQTLGLSEDTILKNLGIWIQQVVDQEWNARRKVFQDEGEKFIDRLARSHGLLRSARLLSSSEAMNMLSLLRMGCDMGFLPEAQRYVIDRLMIVIQPAHIQAQSGVELEGQARDLWRAELMRNAFKNIPEITAIP